MMSFCIQATDEGKVRSTTALSFRVTPPLLKAPTVGLEPPLKLRGGKGEL